MADRLFYAVPTGRHPHPGFVTSMRALEMSCRTFGRETRDFEFAAGPVQMARSTIAEHAIDRGYDYLLMHDDDLVVNPVSALAGNPIDEMHETFKQNPDAGVIGAVYLRERPQIPTVVMSHPEYPEENCHAVHGFPPAPMDVSGIGTGFMMIRVSALRELREKEDGAHALFRFPFNRTRWGLVNHTGEDYDFCARMRGIGYRVLADARFETCHLKEAGPLMYRQADWEAAWTPGALGLEERAHALRASCQPHIALMQIGSMLCLDHVPQLKFEASEKADRKVAEATKEAA